MVNGSHNWPLLPQPGDGSSGESVSSYRPPIRRAVGFAPDDPLRISANLSSESRKGGWAVPPYIVVAPNLSNIRLDLRDALPQSDIIELTVEGVMGSLTLVVPWGWAVDTDRLAKGIGTVRNRISPVPAAGFPVVVVSGSMGMGTFVARGERFYERWGRARQTDRRELLR